jgi:hypothetical protein
MPSWSLFQGSEVYRAILEVAVVENGVELGIEDGVAASPGRDAVIESFGCCIGLINPDIKSSRSRECRMRIHCP